MPNCGRNFTTSVGILQTPNWPQTYPANISCEWFIELPNARKVVEITCVDDLYGIAGAYPECTEDYIKIYDGHSSESKTHGPYCEFTKPGTIKLSSNLARVQFYAGPSHACSLIGVKCSFRPVDAYYAAITPHLITSHHFPTTTSAPLTATSTLTTSPPPLTTSHPFPTTTSAPLIAASTLTTTPPPPITSHPPHITTFVPLIKTTPTPPPYLTAISTLTTSPPHLTTSHPFPTTTSAPLTAATTLTTIPPPPITSHPPPITTFAPTTTPPPSLTATSTLTTSPPPLTTSHPFPTTTSAPLTAASTLTTTPPPPITSHPPLITTFVPLIKTTPTTTPPPSLTTSQQPTMTFVPPNKISTPTTTPPSLTMSHPPPTATLVPLIKTSTPTITPLPPPVPLPQCGGLMNTSNGTFQTPNWPKTYPVNIDCEWRIQLPDSKKLVKISCNEDPFGIAGFPPACDKDFLKFYNGHSKQDTEFGPFCYYTKPVTTVMSSNKAMAIFHAGPKHNAARKGFKCSFLSTNHCGGALTAASGSFQTPYWPQTYPVNINCTWTITLPDSSKRVEINFDTPFGIAGSLPTCVKDKLHIYDDNTSTQYGPYCYFTVPNPPTMTSNRARVVLLAGPAHNPSRVGFRATYRSVP